MSALLGENLQQEEPEQQDSKSAERASESPESSDIPAGLRLLALDDIIPNPNQPRQGMDDVSLDELAQSIREKGIIQPIIVRRHPSEAGKFQIIAGERRFQASKRAELTQVPAIIQEASDEDLLELALIENIQREDLDAIEEGLAYKTLADKFGLSHEQISQRVGRARTTITNTLRLLDLPASLQEFVRSGDLTSGHARALLSLETAEEREQAADHVIKQRLNVRQCEDYVRQRLTGDKPGTGRRKNTAPKPKTQTESDEDLAPLASDLQSSLGTRVTIRRTKGDHGVIELEFYSEEQLTDLVMRLTE